MTLYHSVHLPCSFFFVAFVIFVSDVIWGCKGCLADSSRGQKQCKQREREQLYRFTGWGGRSRLDLILLQADVFHLHPCNAAE